MSAVEDKRKGLLLLGNFRDNEVEEDGPLMTQIKSLERSISNVSVTRLIVRGLLEAEINKMLSYKFCLPTRHTRELAQIVHQKTRGNPLYLIEFLRSLLKNKLIAFSVKSRRWTWDDTPIDMQTMSEGVVELLTRKLKQLPHNVTEALKVVSCFGQLNVSTIELLNSGQFVPDMHDALESAVAAGILERAGPLFAFSHDMLKESSYRLIPEDERLHLHKKIGTSLVQDQKVSDDAELCTLVVDQINICKDEEGILDPAQRTLFAKLNLAAGKHSMATSSFEQARGYFEAGISLLCADPWKEQYDLCLKLHELAVVVSFMDGNVDLVSSRLETILSNAQSFSDTLNCRALQAQLLASQEQHMEALRVFMEVLSKLGEEFPGFASNASDIRLVIGKVLSTAPMLKDVSKEKLLGLPPMTSVEKLSAMKIMGIIASLGHYSSLLFGVLVSCRMVELTLQEGFCEDSIVGLAIFSQGMHQDMFLFSMQGVLFVRLNMRESTSSLFPPGLSLFTDEIQLTSRLCTIIESIIQGHSNEHLLRARMTTMLITVKGMVSPVQAVADFCLACHNSAIVAGDIDNAMNGAMFHINGSFHSAANLREVAKIAERFMHQTIKHKRTSFMHSAMAYYSACIAFVGDDRSCKIDVKTHEELQQIAVQSHNNLLMHQVILCRMCVHLYFREYKEIVDLAEKHRMTCARIKRGFSYCYFTFYEGLCKSFVAGIFLINRRRLTTVGHWSCFTRSCHMFGQGYKRSEMARGRREFDSNPDKAPRRFALEYREQTPLAPG